MSEKYVCLSEFSVQQFERKRMKINFGFKNRNMSVWIVKRTFHGLVGNVRRFDPMGMENNPV